MPRLSVWAAMEGTSWRPVSQIALDEVWWALRFRPAEDVEAVSLDHHGRRLISQ
jgi:hypothetical protein